MKLENVVLKFEKLTFIMMKITAYDWPIVWLKKIVNISFIRNTKIFIN